MPLAIETEEAVVDMQEGSFNSLVNSANSLLSVYAPPATTAERYTMLGHVVREIMKTEGLEKVVKISPQLLSRSFRLAGFNNILHGLMYQDSAEHQWAQTILCELFGLEFVVGQNDYLIFFDRQAFTKTTPTFKSSSVMAELVGRLVKAKANSQVLENQIDDRATNRIRPRLAITANKQK